MAKADAFIQFYIGDHLGDTSHLDGAQQGAYLLLLFHQWRTGPLPDLPEMLKNIARCSMEQWNDHIGPVVMKFFTFGPDGWFQKRLMAEKEKAIRLIEAKVAAGSASAEKRWGQVASVVSKRRRKTTAVARNSGVTDPSADGCNAAVIQPELPLEIPLEAAEAVQDHAQSKPRPSPGVGHASEKPRDFLGLYELYPPRKPVLTEPQHTHTQSLSPSLSLSESEFKKGTEATPPRPAARSASLWSAGLTSLERISKLPEERCRMLIGKWRKALGSDDPALFGLIHEAEMLGIAHPVSWLETAVANRSKPRDRYQRPPSKAAWMLDEGFAWMQGIGKPGGEWKGRIIDWPLGMVAPAPKTIDLPIAGGR